ncbi:MAG TPA: hypothetical protein VJN65_08720 [Bacteroidota bacterium]|nr:hypothetical protein [Bacteroidota bacterium]
MKSFISLISIVAFLATTMAPGPEQQWEGGSAEVTLYYRPCSIFSLGPCPGPSGSYSLKVLGPGSAPDGMWCCPPTPTCKTIVFDSLRLVYVFKHRFIGLTAGDYRFALALTDSGGTEYLAWARPGTYHIDQADSSLAQVFTISRESRPLRNINIYYAEQP